LHSSVTLGNADSQQRVTKGHAPNRELEKRDAEWNIKEWDSLGLFFRLKIHRIRCLVRDAFLHRRIAFGTRTVLSIFDVRKYENTLSQGFVSGGSFDATTHALVDTVAWYC